MTEDDIKKDVSVNINITKEDSDAKTESKKKKKSSLEKVFLVRVYDKRHFQIEGDEFISSVHATRKGSEEGAENAKETLLGYWIESGIIGEDYEESPIVEIFDEKDEWRIMVSDACAWVRIEEFELQN